MLELEKDVLKTTAFLALEDPRRTSQSDTDRIWYVLFKPRVTELVGHHAHGSPEPVRDSNAYDVTYKYLYQVLAPSDETHPSDREDRDDEDEDETDDEDYVGRDELLTILVNQLHLPKTAAYQNKIEAREGN